MGTTRGHPPPPHSSYCPRHNLPTVPQPLHRHPPNILLLRLPLLVHVFLWVLAVPWCNAPHAILHRTSPRPYPLPPCNDPRGKGWPSSPSMHPNHQDVSTRDSYDSLPSDLSLLLTHAPEASAQIALGFDCRVSRRLRKRRTREPERVGVVSERPRYPASSLARASSGCVSEVRGVL